MRFILPILFLFSFNIYARSQDSIPNKFNQCSPSPKYLNNYEPKKFSKSNNLLHRAGQKENYYGQKIIVSGIIVDEECKLVSNAIIYLWQTDSFGRYLYEPLRQELDENLIKLNDKSSFLGSGTATSDNNGTFNFVTIYPKPGNYVNVRVVYQDTVIQTKLFLTKNNSLSHLNFNADSMSNFDNLSKNNIYSFKIVIPFKLKFLKY